MTGTYNKKTKRIELMISGWVVPNRVRCVQCGICSYNCPMGIPVRQYAWQDQPVTDRRCISCGECVVRCPRGVLSFERSPLVTTNPPLGGG